MKPLPLLALTIATTAIHAVAQVQPDAAPPGFGSPPAGPPVCPTIPATIARARASAEHGEPAGQHLLGTFYAEGVILKQDKVEAYAWFSLAGSEDRKALEQTMTAEQIAEGHKRAKQLQEQIEARRKEGK